jgi:hypothetical protein
LKWALPVIIVCGLGALAFAGFVVYLVRREKQGSPMFRPLLASSITGEQHRTIVAGKQVDSAVATSEDDIKLVSQV